MNVNMKYIGKLKLRVVIYFVCSVCLMKMFFCLLSYRSNIHDPSNTK